MLLKNLTTGLLLRRYYSKLPLRLPQNAAADEIVPRWRAGNQEMYRSICQLTPIILEVLTKEMVSISVYIALTVFSMKYAHNCIGLRFLCYLTNIQWIHVIDFLVFNRVYTLPLRRPQNCSSTSVVMTSSNGNIFRVTGHLWGESTGPRWIPITKASDAAL